MILNKALLLKGLGGLAALTGTVGLGVAGKELGWWGGSIDSALKELVTKVGLSCNSENICTQASGKTTNIKQENTTHENKTIPSSGTGKIKVYKDTEGYNEKFKFVIEVGDITLNNGGTTNKLEQFETYEIKEESGNYTLSRKTKASEGIKKALGLPDSCTLPENTNTSGGNGCDSISADNLKNINFDGKQGGGVTIDSGGNATMTITKLTSTDSGFPFGYKFSIQPSQKLTISTNPENSIAPNISVEFKIKKTDGSNQISLEKAWSLETLAAKVGLENCNDSNGCSFKTNGINVKHDNSKEENKTKSTSSSDSQGKIKVYKDTSGYKEGFKFVIEDGDIALSSGTISKLEQFETYEIEEADESGTKKYYLSRKSKAFKEISKALGLPDGCDELTSGNTTDCSNLTKDKLKGINFEGKSNGEVTINNDSGSNIKLKVTKLTTPDTTFPHGYKFVLESNKEITFTNSTPSLTIKPNTNTEFKIKVTDAEGGTKTLTLEKAWDITKLAEKVGLTCTSNGSKDCSLPTNKKINLYVGASDKTEEATIKEECKDKKITYQEDQEGHNQGFKFTVSEDITLNGTSNEEKKIEAPASGSSPSYEIKEDGGKWYLAKKTTS